MFKSFLKQIKQVSSLGPDGDGRWGEKKGGAQPSEKPPLYAGPVAILFQSACLVTMTEDKDVIEEGSIAVYGGKIVAIGEDHALNHLKDQADLVIDASGRVIVPGLINAHCHAGDSLFRGLVEGLALEPWLEKLWVAESAILTPETIRLGSLLGYAENLLCGVTNVVDMFWQPAELLSAAEEIGIRIATGGIFFDPPGMDGATVDQRDMLARDFFTEFGSHPNLIPSISVHGAYTVGPESLKTALNVRDDFESLITIHAAETRAEQKTVKEQYGRSVIHHLEEVGLLSNNAILAHCVHVDEAEIEILARTGAHVAHNPASNLKLGSGIAPVPALMKAGVNVSLGTDGAVSGNDLDMWKAIRLAATLHNGANEDPLAMSAREPLAMATKNGAAALGLAHECGQLSEGMRADLVVINPRNVHTVPVFDPVNMLSYATSHGDIEDVYVAGKQVVRGRQLLTVDIDDIVDRVQALAPQIKATLA